jgi:hypothetical protein
MALDMERQRDEATVKLLKELRTTLFSDNISRARVAAYRLSWMQEDGLAILSEAMFGNYPRQAKKAAAYGLRNMKGRMKKLATIALESGLTHQDKTTKAACLKSLQLMRGEAVTVSKPRRKFQETSPNKQRNTRPVDNESRFNR